ncbi:hypothetical protein [Micromonospora sp. C81]|uniref:hypothetical protein n=1 Tax=Micromonospora sp. C81 TaxID=2824881 RepID=UPI001B364398|nr:hypothetical protein [Micromonospora sp. C81]MBQ1039791.1 hypothetical protein [Micromonospora sp. C81]
MDEFEGLIAELQALGPADFDLGNESSAGWGRLGEVCDRLVDHFDIQAFAPPLFAFLERLDGSDIGAPGPVVHALESAGPLHLPYLWESMRRKPTALGAWMVNRVLNTNPPDAGRWLDLLASVDGHSKASESAVNEAQEFLRYQRSKGR